MQQVRRSRPRLSTRLVSQGLRPVAEHAAGAHAEVDQPWGRRAYRRDGSCRTYPCRQQGAQQPVDRRHAAGPVAIGQVVTATSGRRRRRRVSSTSKARSTACTLPGRGGWTVSTAPSTPPSHGGIGGRRRSCRAGTFPESTAPSAGATTVAIARGVAQRRTWWIHRLSRPWLRARGRRATLPGLIPHRRSLRPQILEGRRLTGTDVERTDRGRRTRRAASRRRSSPPTRSRSSPSCSADSAPRRDELLARRTDRRAAAAATGRLDFLPETALDPRRRLDGGRGAAGPARPAGRDHRARRSRRWRSTR